LRGLPLGFRVSPGFIWCGIRFSGFGIAVVSLF